ncbi:MAG: hypothetical protein AAFY39_01510 [Pseudomonadota bacterium]
MKIAHIGFGDATISGYRQFIVSVLTCVGVVMIASLFLLFVAAGITLATFVYGVGGLFPLLAALTTVALFFQFTALAGRDD